MSILLIFIIALNVVTFLVYGIDKRFVSEEIKNNASIPCPGTIRTLPCFLRELNLFVVHVIGPLKFHILWNQVFPYQVVYIGLVGLA